VPFQSLNIYRRKQVKTEEAEPERNLYVGISIKAAHGF
jgi:hypothetical protein